ncbi:MAG TPA: hypothetical protein VGE16_04280 [Albitalea sp.]
MKKLFATSFATLVTLAASAPASAIIVQREIIVQRSIWVQFMSILGM